MAGRARGPAAAHVPPHRPGGGASHTTGGENPGARPQRAARRHGAGVRLSAAAGAGALVATTRAQSKMQANRATGGRRTAVAARSTEANVSQDRAGFKGPAAGPASAPPHTGLRTSASPSAPCLPHTRAGGKKGASPTPVGEAGRTRGARRRRREEGAGRAPSARRSSSRRAACRHRVTPARPLLRGGGPTSGTPASTLRRPRGPRGSRVSASARSGILWSHPPGRSPR